MEATACLTCHIIHFVFEIEACFKCFARNCFQLMAHGSPQLIYPPPIRSSNCSHCRHDGAREPVPSPTIGWKLCEAGAGWQRTKRSACQVLVAGGGGSRASSSPASTRTPTEPVREGGVCAVFPEGRAPSPTMWARPSPRGARTGGNEATHCH